MRRIGAGVIERVTQAFVCASLLLAPVAATQAATEEDPWEAVNRPIFRFNDTLDTYALKPLAKGYQAVTPQFLEDGIHNIFRNLGDVTNLANNLLQFKPHAAGVDTARLIVNTTFGLGGFFDVGTKMGLTRSDEDFGQTLGFYGVPEGPYIMLPVLGPSNLRDTTGVVVDYAGEQAINYLGVAEASTDHPEIFLLRAVDKRYTTKFRYGQLNSPFEYEKVRYVYTQARKLQIAE